MEPRMRMTSSASWWRRSEEELLGQDKFSFLAGAMLGEFDDPQGEFIGFDLGSVIVLHFLIRNS